MDYFPFQVCKIWWSIRIPRTEAHLCYYTVNVEIFLWGYFRVFHNFAINTEKISHMRKLHNDTWMKVYKAKLQKMQTSIQDHPGDTIPKSPPPPHPAVKIRTFTVSLHNSHVDGRLIDSVTFDWPLPIYLSQGWSAIINPCQSVCQDLHVTAGHWRLG